MIKNLKDAIVCLESILDIKKSYLKAINCQEASCCDQEDHFFTIIIEFAFAVIENCESLEELEDIIHTRKDNAEFEYALRDSLETIKENKEDYSDIVKKLAL